MLINIDFSEEMTRIIQNSKHYTPSRSFTIDELRNISEFAHYFANKKHLNFIQNEGNILYGFCYGIRKTTTGFINYYWMFLDENYHFYDVGLPRTTKEELGDIYDTLEKIMPLMCSSLS